MHLDHLDLTQPAAMVSQWQAPEPAIRTEVRDWLKSLAEAIRKEFRGYTNKDEEEIEEGKLLQRKLINSCLEPHISEWELELFLQTLEDNAILKDTIRMLYGNRQELMRATNVYRAQINALMTGNDPELETFLLAAKRKKYSTNTSSPELEAKLERARKKTGLIIRPDFFPMEDLVAQYTNPRSLPSPDEGEHGVQLHTPEEAPLQSEIGNHLGSSLWQRLRRFPWISDNTSAPH